MFFHQFKLEFNQNLNSLFIDILQSLSTNQNEDYGNALIFKSTPLKSVRNREIY
jgi:hypothetical protein